MEYKQQGTFHVGDLGPGESVAIPLNLLFKEPTEKDLKLIPHRAAKKERYKRISKLGSCWTSKIEPKVIKYDQMLYKDDRQSTYRVYKFPIFNPLAAFCELLELLLSQLTIHSKREYYKKMHEREANNGI